jgi:hypothetical protein
MTVFLVVACTRSGKSDVRHLDFTEFAAADRITVIGLGGVVVAEVSDGKRVRDAARYFATRQNGWAESPKGPSAGVVELRFFNGSKFVGEFQLDKDYIVYGGYHLKVPPEDINALVHTLGVNVFEWPRAR